MDKKFQNVINDLLSFGKNERETGENTLYRMFSPYHYLLHIIVENCRYYANFH
ncbi:hypothetical protein BAXH7_02046 [Bacillus amyloliquefaciens XH7]|nr:hypothetical protein LL3_01528 [Bacillus amyloliquefaciens LL3]AEK89178.1 hypothetical protein BAXH7_02046 [Bacillus amyloliquefaciens XH7]